MKLLLTSTGLSTSSIRTQLAEMLGKPFSEASAVHVPTAIYAEPDGITHAIAATLHWLELGWRQLHTLELTALPTLPPDLWMPTLEAADAVLVDGGNTGYLSYWAHSSGFANAVHTLRTDAVYVGVSAGSILATPSLNYDHHLYDTTGTLYDDQYNETAPPGAGDHRGLGLVDFSIRPHLNSPDFPGITNHTMAAAETTRTLYAIEDDSALAVIDGEVHHVGEGECRRFEGATW